MKAVCRKFFVAFKFLVKVFFSNVTLTDLDLLPDDLKISIGVIVTQGVTVNVLLRFIKAARSYGKWFFFQSDLDYLPYDLK